MVSISAILSLGLRCGRVLCSALLLILATISPRKAFTQTARPSVLTCVSNAIASRDFAFSVEAGWMGRVGSGPGELFGIGTPRQRNGLVLRDKVFAGLDTDSPTIRSISPVPGDTTTVANEFQGTVLSRALESVWIAWKNPPGNKVWVAVVDLARRKAVITQAFQGMTSVGGELETLDCR